MSWDDQEKPIVNYSVFTIHTKDGPLRRMRHSYGGKVLGTPFCTVTFDGAEKIARSKGVIPCVILEMQTGLNEDGQLEYHQIIKTILDT